MRQPNFWVRLKSLGLLTATLRCNSDAARLFWRMNLSTFAVFYAF